MRTLCCASRIALIQMRSRLIIKDQGPGFNPRNLPHAASDEDPIGHIDIRNELGIREGGFGIMLARGLVDKHRYNKIGQRSHAGEILRAPETARKLIAVVQSIDRRQRATYAWRSVVFDANGGRDCLRALSNGWLEVVLGRVAALRPARRCRATDLAEDFPR